MAAFLRSGGVQRDARFVENQHGGSARVVAAVAVAGAGDDLGQHLVGGHVPQAAAQCGFHQLELVVEVVLQGPCSGLMEVDRRRDWLLILVHGQHILCRTVADLIGREGFGGNGAASRQQQRQAGSGEAQGERRDTVVHVRLP